MKEASKKSRIEIEVNMWSHLNEANSSVGAKRIAASFAEFLFGLSKRRVELIEMEPFMVLSMLEKKGIAARVAEEMTGERLEINRGKSSSPMKSRCRAIYWYIMNEFAGMALTELKEGVMDHSSIYRAVTKLRSKELLCSTIRLRAAEAAISKANEGTNTMPNKARVDYI